MKTKTVRLVVGCLVIVAMLLVSCTTTVTQEQDEAVPTIEEEVITEAEEITIPFTTVEVIKNVEYGRVGDIPLPLDIYIPETPIATPMPVIIWIHGGSFKYGDKSKDPMLRSIKTLAERVQKLLQKKA